MEKNAFFLVRLIHENEYGLNALKKRVFSEKIAFFPGRPYVHAPRVGAGAHGRWQYETS